MITRFSVPPLSKSTQNLARVANRINDKLGLGGIDSLVVDGIPTFGFWRDVLNADAVEYSYDLTHYDV